MLACAPMHAPATLFWAAALVAGCTTPASSPRAGASEKPTPKDPVVAWLDSELVPLGQPDSLEPLSKVLGSRAVVAMGEATHGPKEFFELKHRFLRNLVEARPS